MSQFNNTSLYRLVTRVSLMLMLCVGVSCSDSSIYDGVSVGDGDNMVSLNIVVSDIPTGGTSSRASRAPGYLGDGYDRGAGYENYIDIDKRDFMFLFFDTDDRYLGVLSSTNVYMIESTTSSKTYSVLGQITRKVAEAGTVKVMALANWNHAYPDAESITEGMSMADINRSVYTFSADKMLPGEDSPIPLYGVTNPVTLDFDNLNRADIGTIHLLRAYAKIEVCPAQNTNALIERVTLTRYNTSGYRAPLGVTCQDDYVKGSYDADYTPSLYIPGDVTVAENLPFAPTSDGKFVAYVPEYMNTTGTPAKLAIHFVGLESDPDDVVEFKYYQAPAGHEELQGKPFDLCRNYWYRFNVKKIRNIEVEVIVVPYAETVLNPDFGLLGPDAPKEDEVYQPVLNARFDDVLYYRNQAGSTCLTTEPLTPVRDPATQIDPVTNYQMIIADFSESCRDVLVCYYDPVTKLQYAPDRKTPVRVTVSHDDLGLITYTELKLEDGAYVMNGLANYYDAINDLWYDAPPTKNYYVGDDRTLYTCRGVQVRDSNGDPIPFDRYHVTLINENDGDKVYTYLRDINNKRFVTALVTSEIFEGPKGNARFFEAETEDGIDDAVHRKSDMNNLVKYSDVSFNIETGLATYKTTDGELLVVSRRMRTSLYPFDNPPYPAP